MKNERDQRESYVLMVEEDFQVLKGSLDRVIVKYFEGLGWAPAISNMMTQANT